MTSLSSRLSNGAATVLMLAIAFASLPGCDGGTPTSTQPTESREEMAMRGVRSMLQNAADYGEAGSALAGFDEVILIAPLDAEVQAKLMAGYKQLSGMSDPEKIKAKASEMLALLPPASTPAAAD